MLLHKETILKIHVLKMFLFLQEIQMFHELFKRVIINEKKINANISQSCWAYYADS